MIKLKSNKNLAKFLRPELSEKTFPPRRILSVSLRNRHPAVAHSIYVRDCAISPFGVQGWRSGESTRLLPMWYWFYSHTRRHMWVEFVGSLLCSERFSPGTLVSPLLKNQHLTCCDEMVFEMKCCVNC